MIAKLIIKSRLLEAYAKQYMLQICNFMKQCTYSAMHGLFQCLRKPTPRKTIWPAVFRLHVKVTTAKPRHCP